MKSVGKSLIVIVNSNTNALRIKDEKIFQGEIAKNGRIF